MHQFDDDSSARAHAPGADHESDVRSVTEAGVAGGPNPVASDAASLLRLQRTVGNAGVVQLLAEDDPHGLKGLVGSGGGSPLDSRTRVQMESAIGADFSGVRVHAGTDADRSAKSLGAHAYTAGNDVVFAEGRYDPGSAAGQRTLAHELTHVVQQRSGPVDGTVTDTGVKVSDPGDPFEQAAEANADRVMSTQSLAVDAPSVAPGTAPVQRQGDEEVQGLFVQREGAEQIDEAEEPAEDVQGMFVQREGEEVEEAEEPEAAG